MITVHEYFTNARMGEPRFENSWLHSWMAFGVAALGETIRIMAEVDEAIEVNGGWPVK